MKIYKINTVTTQQKDIKTRACSILFINGLLCRTYVC